LLDDVGAGVWSQGVVEGHDHHGVAVGALLGEHPFGAVLAVDAHECVGVGLETQSDKARAKVLGSQQRLVVVHPLVRLGGRFAPTKARSIVCKR
jgi:hypothetical protein